MIGKIKILFVRLLLVVGAGVVMVLSGQALVQWIEERDLMYLTGSVCLMLLALLPLIVLCATFPRFQGSTIERVTVRLLDFLGSLILIGVVVVGTQLLLRVFL